MKLLYLTPVLALLFACSSSESPSENESTNDSSTVQKETLLSKEVEVVEETEKPKPLQTGVEIDFSELKASEYDLSKIGSYEFEGTKYDVWNVQSSVFGWEGIALGKDSTSMELLELPEQREECVGCFYPSVSLSGANIATGCFPSNGYEISVNFKLEGLELQFVDCDAVDLNADVDQMMDEARKEKDALKFFEGQIGEQYPKGFEQGMMEGLTIAKEQCDSLIGLGKQAETIKIYQTIESEYFDMIPYNEESIDIWMSVEELYNKAGLEKEAKALADKIVRE
jgi:hypothetical protein